VSDLRGMMVFCLDAGPCGTLQALSHWWQAGKRPTGDCVLDDGCNVVRGLGSAVASALLSCAWKAFAADVGSGCVCV